MESFWDATQAPAPGIFGETGFVLVNRADRPARPTKRLTAVPQDTEPPYWVEALLHRSDLRPEVASHTVQPGLPLLLKINVSQFREGIVCPLGGACVDVWHCNALGVYSGLAAEGMPGQTFLRGYQITDDAGDVRFVTVFPGWRRGEAPRVYCRVRLFAQSRTTHDVAVRLGFEDGVSEAVYARFPYTLRSDRGGEGIKAGGRQDTLRLQLSEDGSRAVAAFPLVLDLSGRQR